MQNDSLIAQNRYFIYESNSIFTSSDKNKHDGDSFRLDDLNNSFNWEMDMETFSMLPFEKDKTFAVNFYHPGSKSLPEYYLYAVNRSEEIEFNGKKYDCWVLRIDYTSGNGHTEFWIDKNTKRTMKMKEVYKDILRIKVLIV
ncbi:hypothetical protein JMN32_25005 [Fulvivirga sp. 29W222]|uniref:Uncharacterized protein n=1 Tax=Fulvivirga marina TaxID=2494733 RepID=A0A937G0T8_9BACT|nr:hypothetical protein [Fulvivirga marina]MBL6449594.1 hypothetical protein [Fulvivirga marina]